jgi:CRISPR-associated protein Csm4
MECDIIKLHFTAPLHLADARPDTYARSAAMLHSDSLKSALFAAICALGIQGNAPKESFDAFRVSSCFPFFQDTFFFPRPFAQLAIERTNEPGEAKKIKKIKWLEKSIFEKTAAAAELPFQDLQSDGEFLLPAGRSVQKLYVKNIQQRKGDNPFEIERLHFAPGAGLYFFVHYDADAARAAVHSGLRLLADTGIGTDRSSGNGFFEFTSEKMLLRLPENATHRMNLSLYVPDYSSGLDWMSQAAYSLVRRTAFVAGSSLPALRNQRSRTIHALGEGSILPAAANHAGSIVNLAPETNFPHPVWRDGRPFLIPFQTAIS